MADKAPAQEGTTIREVFAEHLNALYSAKRAFIQAESSERIRPAMRHQIRPSGEMFKPGDTVYYKRDDCHRWRGPGKIIGQDQKVVFVRHGNIYVRVSPCNFFKVGEEFGNHDPKKNNEPKEEHEKHCLNEKDRNDMEIEESDDENDNHHAENINQYESSSSGEITPSVRVTKNPLKVKDKVRC